MPEQRLEKARASLPLGYQYGDAAPSVADWKSDWPSIPDKHTRLENGEVVRIPQKFLLPTGTISCR